MLPEPNSSVTCDVTVLGIEGKLLGVNVRSSGFVEDPSAWRALLKALSHPLGFNHLRIGLDPGVTCSLAAYADNLLIWVEKLDCNITGKRVKWLLEIVEPRRYTVNVGSGEGFERLAESLLAENLNFNIVPEETTSTRPILSRLKEIIGDEDILAAMTIALTQ